MVVAGERGVRRTTHHKKQVCVRPHCVSTSGGSGTTYCSTTTHHHCLSTRSAQLLAPPKQQRARQPPGRAAAAAARCLAGRGLIGRRASARAAKLEATHLVEWFEPPRPGGRCNNPYFLVSLSYYSYGRWCKASP